MLATHTVYSDRRISMILIIIDVFWPRYASRHLELREYGMIYREPGFLAVVWYGSPQLHLLVSSSGDPQEDWELETMQVVRRREILVIYQSVHTLCLNPSLAPCSLLKSLRTSVLQPRCSILDVLLPLLFRIILIFLYLHQTFSIPCWIKGGSFYWSIVCKMMKKITLIF